MSQFARNSFERYYILCLLISYFRIILIWEKNDQIISLRAIIKFSSEHSSSFKV